MYSGGRGGKSYQTIGKRQGRCRGMQRGGERGAVGRRGVLHPNGTTYFYHAWTMSSGPRTPADSDAVLRAAMPAHPLVSTPSAQPWAARLGVLRAFRSARHSPTSSAFLFAKIVFMTPLPFASKWGTRNDRGPRSESPCIFSSTFASERSPLASFPHRFRKAEYNAGSGMPTPAGLP